MERLNPEHCGLGHPGCKDHDPEFPAADPARAGICEGCHKVRPRLWQSPRFGWYCAECIARAIRIANWRGA